jgi:hypothetical protein
VSRPLKRVLKVIAGLLPLPTLCRLFYRGRRAEIPIVLCFDVEPDDRAVDPKNPGPWRGFEDQVQRIAPLRERLSKLSQEPVVFTWFIRMDPQIAATWGSPSWAAESYGNVFAQLRKSGDELGLHTHLWRWDDAAAEWTTDHDEPAWGTHCLTEGLDAFESAFGTSCPVYRGGDRFLSGEMLARLETRGVKADLTVEPGIAPTGTPIAGERARGLTPDYRGVPTQPYRSSPATFPAPDPAKQSGPLLVPLTTGPALRGGWGRIIGIGAHPSLFAARLLAELLRGPPPVLVFALRTDPTHLRMWSAVVKNMEHLARHPGTRFVTASAATVTSSHQPGGLATPRSSNGRRQDSPKHRREATHGGDAPSSLNRE